MFFFSHFLGEMGENVFRHRLSGRKVGEDGRFAGDLWEKIIGRHCLARKKTHEKV